jgi:hemerythrin
MTVIPAFEECYVLGIDSMDQTHREFVDLVNQLAASDEAAFIPLLRQLVEHTHAHFAAEESLMVRCAFPATAEHRADHARVLGELARLQARTERGRTALARAYVGDQLPP